MKFWLEIQRSSGIDRREVKPNGDHGIAEGSCPGCGADPFIVQGGGIEKIGDGLHRAGGVSRCCHENVGYLYAERETLFGEEEDRAMTTFARCRVYY